MLETDELDLAKSDPPPTMESGNALLEAMDRGFARSKSALTSTNDQDLEKRWAMKMNGQLIYDWSKYEAIRHALNQITHHRAQLGVYYRLLEIPLPASYGPSADETFS